MFVIHVIVHNSVNAKLAISSNSGFKHFTFTSTLILMLYRRMMLKSWNGPLSHNHSHRGILNVECSGG